MNPLMLGLLRQISGLTARVDELVAQNKALLARIAELDNGDDLRAGATRGKSATVAHLCFSELTIGTVLPGTK
jgi:cell division protein FtsB